jgi:hypothetical protein
MLPALVQNQLCDFALVVFDEGDLRVNGFVKISSPTGTDKQAENRYSGDCEWNVTQDDS